MSENNDLYGILGYPLGHSFSKKYFEEKFIKEHIPDANFIEFELSSLKNLKNLIHQQKNLKGLSVTIPYKKEIISQLDSLNPEILKIGAVNCIKVSFKDGKQYLRGYNTDVVGFELSIQPILKSHHQKAMIIGTGGAAMAVAYVFEKLNINYIFISRQPNGCKQIRYTTIDEKIMNEHLLIVNTTPLGMYPHIDSYPQIPYHLISQKHLLVDLIYNPAETAFLKKGKEKGASIKNGYEMLKIQADEAWKIWNNQ